MNHITIELCTEDRVRLDRIAELLEKQAGAEANHCACNCKTENIPEQMTIDTAPVEATTDATAKPADVQTEVAPTTTTPTDETLIEVKKPSVSLEQIQQKVMQLAATNNGAKKDRVRDIISTYAKKVSELPEDKWDEVWGKLLALESEA